MLTYLATPFWHANAIVRAARAEAADHILSTFISRREPTFCPISQCYHMRHLLPKNFETWAVDYDISILQSCTKLVIALMPGYDSSRGVRRETEFAIEKGIEIEFTPCEEILKSIEYSWSGTHTTLWAACSGPPGVFPILKNSFRFLEEIRGSLHSNS